VSPGVLLVEARTSLLQCSYRYQPQPASTVCACFWHGGRFSHIRICRVFTIENNESAVWCHASWKCWLALPLSMQCRVSCDGKQSVCVVKFARGTMGRVQTARRQTSSCMRVFYSLLSVLHCSAACAYVRNVAGFMQEPRTAWNAERVTN